MRPFQSELVLEERISEARLRAYHVGFEENRFRLMPLVDIIRKVIPEFALGPHVGNSAALTDIVDLLSDAAKTVYLTNKYERRGEFGELILHLLLRDFCGTVPLVSKIYFKDSINHAVHGFDSVHVSEADGQKRRLWLGESKLYADGKAGVAELARDVANHIAADYLRSEFTLVSRKIPADFKDVHHWRALMDKHQKLDKIYSSIVIPLVCTYTSPLFETHTEESEAYFSDFEKEMRALLDHFEDKCIQTDVELLLMLLPVESKSELNSALDDRLRAMQKM